MSTPHRTVHQLRLVVTVEDLDAALAFYRDALGMPVEEAFEAEGDARVAILDAGRATLELANRPQVEFIDRVETDGATSPPLRVAFQVADADGVTRTLVEAGAELVASPRETPWRSRNARLEAPGDLQVTVFEELEPPRRQR